MFNLNNANQKTKALLAVAGITVTALLVTSIENDDFVKEQNTNSNQPYKMLSIDSPEKRTVINEYEKIKQELEMFDYSLKQFKELESFQDNSSNFIKDYGEEKFQYFKTLESDGVLEKYEAEVHKELNIAIGLINYNFKNIDHNSNDYPLMSLIKEDFKDEVRDLISHTDANSDSYIEDIQETIEKIKMAYDQAIETKALEYGYISFQEYKDNIKDDEEIVIDVQKIIDNDNEDEIQSNLMRMNN